MNASPLARLAVKHIAKLPVAGAEVTDARLVNGAWVFTYRASVRVTNGGKCHPVLVENGFRTMLCGCPASRHGAGLQAGGLFPASARNCAG
jgi:hypothetical protein